MNIYTALFVGVAIAFVIRAFTNPRQPDNSLMNNRYNRIIEAMNEATEWHHFSDISSDIDDFISQFDLEEGSEYLADNLMKIYREKEHSMLYKMSYN